MAYADLVKEQKNLLDDWLNQFRAVLGELARLNNHISAIDTLYNYGVSDILALLSNNDIVPNKGGLAGASSMTKDEIITCMSYLQGVAQYNTTAHRGNMSKACGITNLVG